MALECWIVAASPIIAVQTQKFIERASDRRKRRQWIFAALMAMVGAYSKDGSLKVKVT
jgi:hypothetical protein